MNDGVQHLTSLVWSVADLLRGDYKQSDYGKVILPFTVLRRLECVLEPTRNEVAALANQYENGEIVPRDLLQRASGHVFYNTSDLTLRGIAEDPQNATKNLQFYVRAFSGDIRGILDRFDFDMQIRRLGSAGLLQQVTDKFADVDLRPDLVPDNRMSFVFEELIRRFVEHSNETAGEHFTPRDVIRLIVNLLVSPDMDIVSVPGAIRTVMDPTCGTGGMLSAVEDRIKALNPDVTVDVYGQELNPESWAICRSNFLIKGKNPENIAFGNSLSDDGHAERKFDYLLASPPFGVEWKRVQEEVEREHRELAESGRFGAGMPRINDGSLLFLQHMISKMKPVEASGEGGSRVAIVFNGSPLSTGAAGSGESEIRRWILENDWLEGVVALPEQLFYNTGIFTYVWIVTNCKASHRKGRVVLLDARDEWQKMRKSLGDKRREVGNEHIRVITELYGKALEVSQDPNHPLHAKVKVLPNEYFGYQQVTVEQPLKLRFEANDETLAALAAAKPVQRLEKHGQFVAAVRTLQGSSWRTQSQALTAMKKATAAAGLIWPTGGPFNRALRDTIGVRDPRGEVQRARGVTEADAKLREYKRIPLGEEVDDYLARDITPKAPDAWVDPAKVKTGYQIRPELFFVARLKAAFEPLEEFCRLVTERIDPQSSETEEEAPEDGNSYLKEKLRHLRAQDLHVVDSALELLSPSEGRVALTPCAGGDIVGRPGSWRLLPQAFGQAVTSLVVLHPHEQRTGRALCEWLNSATSTKQLPSRNDLMMLPVPADVVRVEEFDDLLENVQSARHRLRVATSGLLPNVFSGADSNIQELRRTIQATDAEALLIGGLTQALEDPVSRAEWSYPFHAAALARRYRISSITPSTHPAERMDSLLKLGEGIARTLGIIALAELAQANREEFLKTLRKQFKFGATFGTWTTILGWRAAPGWVILDPDVRTDAYSRLKRIKDFRNSGSAHAHGVREMHEIGDAADELEQLVLLTLRSVSWLAATHWDWVERCEYLDMASYNLVKQRLRGSHPAWEPLEESSQYPLRPKRIYVGNGPARAPLDLWPLASVDVCSDCNTRELFLVDKVEQGVLTLKSLRDHPKEITYPDL
ncbi:SAM-dependent DNA methyltransferase [Streptomyces sp. RHZ10]|uniref:site-specific DNA-methyltransferase (adenine-specific) n=1 Tax=Streptomyces durocortorensis TaxID=2811104 RepID=A0ABS2HMJ6_9ACTN|nr:SAM-dependent DNA methyltransferase [Streptomyces durocortorensis]